MSLKHGAAAPCRRNDVPSMILGRTWAKIKVSIKVKAFMLMGTLSFLSYLGEEVRC